MATKKQFRLKVAAGWLATLCFACVLAYSAAPMRAQAQQGAQPPLPKAIEVDGATLDSYQGQYATETQPDNILSVFHEGGSFFVEGTRVPRTELFAETKTSFFAKTIPLKLNFVLDAEGKVTGFTSGTGGPPRLAKRISEHPVHNHFRPYERKEVMIPMRDGVKLHAVILRPTDTTAALPFIFQRTPYGVDEETPEDINPGQPELAASGYIFVFEDIRGRYKSEGQFLMMRPIADHRDPTKVDESTDAYDTVGVAPEECAE